MVTSKPERAKSLVGRRLWCGAALLSVVWALAACDDPKDPQTWIKRLRDPERATEAVRKLQELGDPVAVEPLCALFKEYPSPTILQAVISFKDARSVPTLKEALDFTDEERYHNSTKAAKALADMKAVDAVPDLLKVLTKQLPIKSRANLAKQGAIEALAQLGDKSAVPGLIKIAEGRPEYQDFYLNKVAIRALGKLGDARAVPVLIRSLFMSSTLQGSSFPQANLALVRIGEPAIKPLIAALDGKDEALNSLAKELSFREGVVESKTAAVLGDLRAKAAVPVLLAHLRRAEAGEGGIAGLEGVVEGLAKIGDPSAATAVMRLATSDKADGRLRVKAARALPLLGDKRAVQALLKLAESGYLEGGQWDLRVEAAMAYSRMVGARADTGLPVLKAVLKDEKVARIAAYAPVKQAFEQAVLRTEMAVECGDKVKCYADKLAASETSAPQREKAAVMIGLLPEGREALASVVKALPTRDPGLRQFLLETAKRIGKATDKELVEVLEKLAERDSKRKAKFHGADLGRLDNIALAVVKRAN